MMALSAQTVVLGEAGYFRIWARPPGGDSVEVTFFRGIPTQIESVVTQDPFTDASLTLSFPQITAFDRPGSGDLVWLVPGTDITVRWENVGENSFSWTWEGFSVDETLTLSEQSTSLSLECKGALYQVDNYLAKPFFPPQPWPYERLIYRALLPEANPGLRTKPLVIIWPEDWNRVVPPFREEDYLGALKPYGVSPGDRWTGLTSRATGGWEQSLTGFVQSLLSVMWDEGGSQWTLRMDSGRQPVLSLRTPPSLEDEDLLVIDLGTPGVELNLSRDFTQSANVVYGIGTDLANTTFSGMQINQTGEETTYEPFAASRSVYPDAGNPSYNLNLMRRETQMRFPNGIDEITARDIAQGQLQRFADPGYTGELTLRTDPYFKSNFTSFPRMLIKAGRSILVRGLRGETEGMMFHITNSSISFADGTATLTIDSKYRDQLTVDEVRARTRDALTPLRSLQAGQFSTTINDLMKPWSYSEGSGMIPRESKELFLHRIPSHVGFPWEEWTRKYPPRDPACEKFYIKIQPARRGLGEAKYNWSGEGTARAAIPIYLAQNGTIRLSQIAAYDKDGNVMKVRFHVGIYDNPGVDYQAMPRVSSVEHKILQPPGGNFGYDPKATGYKGDITPFIQGAFEHTRPDGSEYASQFDLLPEGANLVMGWGNFYEPAGYSPGLYSRNPQVKTGMLIDETTWQFDTTVDPNWSKYSREDMLNSKLAGLMYVMIYCDDHPTDEPVYFLGRLWRQEPGQA